MVVVAEMRRCWMWEWRSGMRLESKMDWWEGDPNALVTSWLRRRWQFFGSGVAIGAILAAECQAPDVAVELRRRTIEAFLYNVWEQWNT